MPIDYEDDLTDILATDSKKKDLIVKKVDGPTFDLKELAYYNQTDYLWFTIDVTEVTKKAIKKNEESVVINIEEFFKRRRMPFPKRISLLD